MTYGKHAKVRTINAPTKPESPGCHEIHAKAERYDGIASGKENAIVSGVRPGSPDMVITQAANVPMTTLATVTPPANTLLRMMSDSVRSWNNSSING
jgi:hypothetical protein